jgi:hypothetical protein
MAVENLIKCIDDDNNYKITKHLVYEIINQNDNYYYVINDAGEEVRYSKKFFEKYNPPFNVAKFISKYFKSGLKRFRNDLNSRQLHWDNYTIYNSKSNCGLCEIHGIHSTLSSITDFLSGCEIKDRNSIEYKVMMNFLFFKFLENRNFNLRNQSSIQLYSGVISKDLNKYFCLNKQNISVVHQMLCDLTGCVTNSIKNPNSSSHIFAFLVTNDIFENFNIITYLNDKFDQEIQE